MDPRGRGGGRGAGINKPAWMVAKEREEAAASGPSGGGAGAGESNGRSEGGGGDNGKYADADERRRSRSRSRDRGSGERGAEPDQFGRTNRGGGGRDYDDRRGGGRDYDDRRDRGYDRRRDDYDRRDHDRRDYGRRDYGRRDEYERRGGGRSRHRPPPGGIHFRSYEEERAWLDDRARKRRSRKSLFDVEPTAAQLAEDQARAALEVAHNTLGRSATGATGANVGLNAGRYGSGGGGGGSMQPQQTRHARRLYVGNVPDLTESDIHNFFRDAIRDSLVLDPEKNPSHSSHRNQYVDNDPIISVYINKERRFAFLEFKTMEITTACLALDGIDVMGRGKVKVKRPNDYNAALAPAVNPATAARLDTAALGIVSPTVPDGPNKIFIGGLPYHLTEAQVLELLGAFGTVRAFHLVKQDAQATTSKGYCFVEYSDPNVTQVACMGLNGMDMGGGKQLSCRMAAEHLRQQQQASQVTMESGGGQFGATVSALPVQQSVVDGVNVDALLSAAMGGGGMPMALPGAMPGAMAAGPMGGMMQQQQPMMGMMAQPQMGMAQMGMMQQPQMLQQPVVADPMAVANAAASALDMAFGAMPAAAPVAAAPMAAAPAPVMPPAQASAAQAGPTRVLVLLNMVTDEDIASEEDHKMLEEEVQEEVSKYGKLKSMKIPRPQDGYAASAVKKIFLEYATPQDAASADGELKGRAFGPNVVDTRFFSEDEYARNNLS
ncbi:hypothetical protein ACHAXT_006673 [Thalassiosira profunda]